MVQSALVHADGANILGGNLHTIRKNTEALLVCSKDICLEVNADKTKYIVTSRCQNEGSSNNIRTDTKVGTLIVATIYLQLIQNRYTFRSFTVLQCSHQYCVQPVASDVEVVGYL